MSGKMSDKVDIIYVGDFRERWDGLYILYEDYIHLTDENFFEVCEDGFIFNPEIHNVVEIL